MTTQNHDSDPICGNCGKPRSRHIHYNDGDFCNDTTNGDVFTSEPSDATLMAWMRKTYSVWVRAAAREWSRHHGHGG